MKPAQQGVRGGRHSHLKWAEASAAAAAKHTTHREAPQQNVNRAEDAEPRSIEIIDKYKILPFPSQLFFWAPSWPHIFASSLTNKRPKS